MDVGNADIAGANICPCSCGAKLPYVLRTPVTCFSSQYTMAKGVRSKKSIINIPHPGLFSIEKEAVQLV
jgi:hypothetical protein